MSETIAQRHPLRFCSPYRRRLSTLDCAPCPDSIWILPYLDRMAREWDWEAGDKNDKRMPKIEREGRKIDEKAEKQRRSTVYRRSLIRSSCAIYWAKPDHLKQRKIRRISAIPLCPLYVSAYFLQEQTSSPLNVWLLKSYLHHLSKRLFALKYA